ncbi:MAG: alpha/beta fold hydrolase [Methylophaga sp.]
MKLHYQMSGEGQPLLIIHGLFGSSDNWRSMARYFSKFYRVISVDLRNHGRSPHSEEQSFTVMAQDIARLCEELNLGRVHILGHSLGGKVAMQFAANHAGSIDKLVVIDISPRQYFSQHTPLMDAMMSLDLTRLDSRSAVDEALAGKVADKSVRQFLLMNLQMGDKGFYWRINLPVLKANYQQLMAPVCEGQEVPVNSLFVYGSLSEYVTEDDRALIKRHFPRAKFQAIDKAGHWVHSERPQQFKRVVEDYLTHD